MNEFEDIDIAAHHDQCACMECNFDWDSYEPDGDELVKFWKENEDDRFERREQVA